MTVSLISKNRTIENYLTYSGRRLYQYNDTTFDLSFDC